MRRRGRPPYPDLLTPREQEVLSLVREGLTNEQIAASLGISLSGARYHVSEILGKLGVASRAEAAAWREEQLTPARRFGFALPFFGLKGLKLAQAAVIAVAAVAFALLALGVLLSSNDTAPEDSAAAPDAIPSPEVDDLTALIGPHHQLAGVREDNRVVLIELESMWERVIIPAGECGAEVIELLWSPSGDMILCLGWKSRPPAADEHVLAVYNLSGDRVYGTEGYIPDPRWSPEHDLFAYVTTVLHVDPELGLASRYGPMKVIDPSGRIVLEEGEVYTRVAWSKDGQRLAAARTDGTIGVYEPGRGLVDSLQVEAIGVDAWVFEDERLIVLEGVISPEWRYHAHLLSTETLELQSIGPRSFWVSPDGRRAITLGAAPPGGEPGNLSELRLLDFEDGSVTPIPGSRIGYGSDSIPVENLRFSTDGQRVVWVDGTGVLWEASLDSLQVRRLHGETFGSRVVLSPDLTLIVTGGYLRAVDDPGSLSLGRIGTPAWRPR